MTVYTTKSRAFQSPQWGDSSKVNDEEIISAIDTIMFQSPQWGDNSKGAPLRNRITKPLKMHFPAEIAVLKNNADDTFQKHL